MDWCKYEDQAGDNETIINIDYYDRKVYIYTSRRFTALKLIKKIGKPDKIETIDGKPCAISYIISFSQRDKLRKAGISTLYVSSDISNNDNLDVDDEDNINILDK